MPENQGSVLGVVYRHFIQTAFGIHTLLYCAVVYVTREGSHVIR
jgi:hypothetical protein